MRAKEGGPIGAEWNSSVSQTCPYLRSAGPGRRILCAIALSNSLYPEQISGLASRGATAIVATLGLSFTFPENYRAAITYINILEPPSPVEREVIHG